MTTATPLQAWLKKNSSPTELGRKVGLSRVSIYRIAKGDQDPPLSVAAKIEEATGRNVTLADLAATVVASDQP